MVAVDGVTLEVAPAKCMPDRPERGGQDHPHSPDRRQPSRRRRTDRFLGKDITRLPPTSAWPRASRAATRSRASSGASACSTTSRSPCRRAAARASLLAAGGRGGGAFRGSAGDCFPDRAFRKNRLSASSLSHGEQRALEVGLALATRPSSCCSMSRWPAWGRRSPGA